VDSGSAKHLERASRLLGVFEDALAQQWQRAQVVDAVREIEGLSTDHKLVKGMAKVLFDRCEFTAQTIPIEDAPTPAMLRATVFALSASVGPLARHGGPTHRRTAASIFSEVAETVGCTTEQVSAALYADLKEEQRLVKATLPVDGQRLLQRYNLALVQSVLLRASTLTVRLYRPEAKRLRQLFRYLKFHRLMYRVRQSGGVVTLELSGPQSLLKQSSRYGLQLATFFPAVVLQTGEWEVDAEILWGKRRLRKVLTLDHTRGLKSHYQDRGVWRSQTEEWFEERFLALDSSWSLLPGELIDLGGQQFLIPDFTFRDGKRVAHLDIVGYWRRGYLKKRIAETPANVMLAVSRRLAGEAVAFTDAQKKKLITFAEIIPAKTVLKQLESVAVVET